MFENFLTDDLVKLNEAFKANGYNLWFVGGCVRDAILGENPKDIDLSTDAGSTEQAEIYSQAGFVCIPTGLHHGTYTVVLGDKNFEVTSLRGPSLEDDLRQRDFTINAMAVDFDLNLIDPFGGSDDLKNGTLKFVDDMDKAISADPIRMLRYFRFASKIGSNIDVGFSRQDLLKNVNGERVWTELSKSLLSKDRTEIFAQLLDNGLLQIFGIEASNPITVCGDPILMMVSYIRDPSLVFWAGRQFGWTSKEKARAMIAAEIINGPVSLQMVKAKIATGTPRFWIEDAVRVLGSVEIINGLKNWKVPKFPIGRDELDEELYSQLRYEWAHSGFTLSEKNLRKRLV